MNKMQICKNCGYIQCEEDVGEEYCSFCLTKLDVENNFDEFWEVVV